MRKILAFICVLSLAEMVPTHLVAAQVDARPPDRLTLSGNGSEFDDTGDRGGGGSLNWLHYFTPDALIGIGAEHQFIEDSSWTFGSLRGAYSRGQPSSRFTVFGEAHYGDGDDIGREFDYSVAVLGISQGFTTRFSVQLETRQIDIDRTHGNLPKLGLTYVWTPRLLTNVSYADSVGGNLGTELTSVRVDYYGRLANLLIGGAFGKADPIVLNSPGLSLPAQDFTEGFIGLGKTFSRGEVQLLGDYLKLDESEKVTLTLSFTVYVGSRGRNQ
jgi:hypothetical protein